MKDGTKTKKGLIDKRPILRKRVEDLEKSNGSDGTVRGQSEVALQQSARRFQAIYEQAPLGVGLVNSRTGQFLQINPKYCEIVGRTEKEMLKLNFQSITHPDDIQRDLDNIAALLDGKIKSFNCEKRYLKKDGSIVWINLTVVPMWIKGDDSRYQLAMVEDITDRKRTEEALRRAEGRYRNIFENAVEGIYQSTVDGRFIEANPAFARILGYDSPEELMTTVTDIGAQFYVDPGKRREFIQITKERGAGYFEVQVRSKDGRIKWLSNNVRAIRDVRGQVTHFEGFVEDITDSKQAEEALRESESRFRLIAENMSDMIRLTDINGVNLYVSPSHKRHLGYNPEDSTGRNIMEFVHPEDLGKVLNVYQHAFTTLSPGKAEYRFKHAAGHYVWLETIGDVVFDERGSIKGGVLSSRNITDRKLAEEAARQSEDRFKKAFHSMPAPIMITTIEEGRFIDVNDSCVRTLGYSREEMIGQTVFGLSIWPDHGVRMPVIRKLLKQGFARNEVIHLRTKKGDIRYTLWSAELIPLQDRQVILSIFQDITEREQMEKELTESGRQLRALAANLESLREKERTKLSREIHDEFGQSLTALKMDLAWLTGRLPKDQELLIDKARSMQKRIDDNVKLIRNIATRLRPGILDDFGLLAAMEWQAEDFEKRTGIECRVRANVKKVNMDGDKASSLFRIFQEALTNVARHSKATKVDVHLRREKKTLIMKIHDNGIGLDGEKLRGRKSLGILGIRERIDLFGGKFTIQGIPQEGTEITILIPIQEGEIL